MEVEAVDPHRHAAQLDHDIRTLRQCTDRSRPLAEHLVALAGIDTDGQRPSDMVQADARVRERPRQRGQLIDLRMIQPCVERQVQRRQAGKALPERRVRHQSWRRRVGRVHQRRIGIPRCDVANAAEPSAAGTDMCLQHVAHALAQSQIGMADDTGAHLGLAVTP